MALREFEKVYCTIGIDGNGTRDLDKEMVMMFMILLLTLAKSKATEREPAILETHHASFSQVKSNAV